MTHTPIRQVAILVGGKGTRLGDITRDVPKPMLPIGGDLPFLDYLLEMVARHGYEDILLLAGHLGERVVETYEGRRIGEAKVRVLCERDPLGTGGALTNARAVLDERFILMNGDALFDINLRALEAAAATTGAIATLALRVVDEASRYGRVIVDGGRVVSFREKDPGHRGPGTINGGIYVLKRDILNLIEHLPCSIEQAVFPRLAEQAQIQGLVFDGYFLDIGIPEALEQGHRELPLVRYRPAAFLDRDGVINVDEGYTFQPHHLRFLPGVVDAIRLLNDRGYFVFVVTNQAGVARGFYTLDDAHRFNREIQTQLAAHGAHVDRFYLSPYHRDGIVPEYATDHFDRKPNPGMLLRALAEWPVVRHGSFLIGDKDSDLKAADGAGIPGYLYVGGDVSDVVRSILQESPRVEGKQPPTSRPRPASK